MTTAGRNDRLRILAPVPYIPVGYAPMALVEALGYGGLAGADTRVEPDGSPDEVIEAVAAGRADAGIVNTVLGLLKRDRGRPIKAVYSFARKTNRTFAVPAASAMTRLADLRGATVGLHFPDLLELARAALVDEGVDPDRDVTFVPLPGDPLDAGPMTDAVRSGKIQAIWALDWLHGVFAGEGLPLRRLPARTLDRLTPSACMFTSDACLAQKPEALGALGRAIARATLFCLINPEAAVRLVWRDVPETRPALGTEVAALRRDVDVLGVRLENQRIEDQKVPRWGAITDEEVRAWEEFLLRTGAIQGRRPPREYYTPALVDRFNDFDAEQVIAQARAFRLEP
jgi:NitT/TauT family transport system substrate-binding protein